MASPPSSIRLLALMLLAVIVPRLPVAKAQSNVLYSPGSLSSGRSLTYGGYTLTMQGDCNLVLYAGGAVWATGTNGRGTNCRATMQSDGNLVVYNGAGQAVWASNSNVGNGNYVLILQPDRNLVVYGPARWSSRTNVRGAGVTVVPHHSLTAANKTLTRINQALYELQTA